MIHYISCDGIGGPTIARELRVLRREGVPFTLHSMRKPHAAFFGAEWALEIERRTHYLYPLSIPSVLISALLAPFLFGSRFWAGLANACFGRRESPRVRLACFAHFWVACDWARHLRRGPVSRIHSQWIHSCGSIGMYAAWLLGVPFSFTGHAVDLFRDRAALADKVRRADFIVCISNFHKDLYKKYGARDAQLHVIYTGIDAGLFEPKATYERADARVRILSIGRLVEKKGFEELIRACGLLKGRGFAFDCTIAGSGPLRDALRGVVEELGLNDCVHLSGNVLRQEELPDVLRESDIYCQPCVWSRDNDVDGLPATLMEAMAVGLPVISTRIAGIPDLVVEGETGLLVEPRDVPALAEAMAKLIEQPEVCRTLGVAGRAFVLERFDVNTCIDPLVALFRDGEKVVETSSRAAAGEQGRGTAARVEPARATATTAANRGEA